MCHRLFSFNTSAVISKVSMENSSKLACSWRRPKHFQHVSVTLLWSVPAQWWMSRWLSAVITLVLIRQAERREEKTKGLSVCTLFRFPREGDLISVCRSAAVTVTSFPARLGLSRLGAWARDLDICLFFQQTERREVQASSQSISVYTTDVFLCEVFLGLLREDWRHVLSSLSLCVVVKRKYGSFEEKMFIQGHSSRVSGKPAFVLIFHCFIEVSSSDTLWLQMFPNVRFSAIVNPSVYWVLHITLHFYG